MKPKIIDLEQGSEAWLSYRRNKISATDTAKVMGFNPWCTPYALWEEKLGYREPQILNDKMKEGNILEEHARNAFNKELALDFKPVVLEHCENNWQIASLDGMASNGQILEIKCGAASHEMAKCKEIPPYYFAQLQKQMWCSESDFAYYVSYRSDDDWIYWPVDRDDKFIKAMNEQEKIFYDCLINLIPPELTDKDYVIREDKTWRMHAEIYKETKEQIRQLQEKEEDLRKEFLRLADGKPSKGYGITISKVIRKGTIDYNAIEILKSIDLEKYRKEPIKYMSVRHE